MAITMEVVKHVAELERTNPALAAQLLASMQAGTAAPSQATPTRSQLVPTVQIMPTGTVQAQTTLDRPLTKAEIEVIISEGLAGVSGVELAKRFGVTSSTISYHQKKAKLTSTINAKPGRPRISQAVINKALDLYATGLYSQAEIAAKVGISKKTFGDYYRGIA